MTGIAGYSCLRCGSHFSPDLEIDARGCPKCRNEAPANLKVAYEPGRRSLTYPVTTLADLTPSLWRYSHMLPCSREDAISLGEGLTPLLPAAALGKRLGISRLLLKDESKNPTWSHKDRFSTVAVSVARLKGARVVATASTGNAGASLAAYAARAGLHCVVVTSAGTGGSMLAQIRKYGAIVLPVAKKAERWPLLAACTRRFGWFTTSPFQAPVVGSHPIGIEGYKTLAYEIVEQMHGSVPDWCALPVCYGDALVGLWQGFEDWRQEGKIDRVPKLVAAEIHGSLARTLTTDSDVVEETMAKFDTLAVSIGATRSTYQALKALRASGGTAIPVDNCGLIQLQENLAQTEGLLVELASVTPFAAISVLKSRGMIRPTESVVAILTGSGLKDLDRSTVAGHSQPAFHSVNEAIQHVIEHEALQDCLKAASPFVRDRRGVADPAGGSAH